VSDGLKWCYQCKRRLPKDLFYKNRAKWDGLMNRCKDCGNVHHQEQAKKEARKKARRATQKRYVERHQAVARAHSAVKRALEQGVLTRKSCEVCGEPDAVAHHDDYSQPLSVRWLCQPHHIEHHYGNLPWPIRANV
jgi:uncharacterized OB-fold protein